MAKHRVVTCIDDGLTMLEEIEQKDFNSTSCKACGPERSERMRAASRPNNLCGRATQISILYAYL